MSLHPFMNTREAYAEDAAHTIERVRGLEPILPARYDEARARAIAFLGARYVFHRANNVLPLPCNFFSNVFHFGRARQS